MNKNSQYPLEGNDMKKKLDKSYNELSGADRAYHYHDFHQKYVHPMVTSRIATPLPSSEERDEMYENYLKEIYCEPD